MAESLVDSRVWFITGSSQGFGKALLEELLGSNERVVATLRRPEVLAPLSEKYPASQLLVLPLDVTVQEQVSAAFEATKAHFGKLDVVVNNAGFAVEGEIESISEEDARSQMEVLFWAPVHITKEALKFMRDVNPPGHGGRILNISSTFGYLGPPTLSYYAAGKFALEAFTQAFTKEVLPSWNVKAIIVEPGGFRTEWNKGSMVRAPVHPKYDASDSASVLFRKVMAAQPIGDPKKAARAFIQIADLPDPPLRIQLGSESWTMVREQALGTLRDNEKYADLAYSTNADDVDHEAVIARVKEASA
ncbi:Uncharacterized oxidoreductase [Sparassis crispa]|uniref:Uncharacterized oxidoreductase n=1 Tax=Sparassis crispa TaxID=139825 RepID=A0A401GL26_9APHY|nr:Uncharacterized oxidoreductase [Sparassis crispa]GBE82875.1 Uncharacterized oxidoreductase [Sparassis crispa]